MSRADLALRSHLLIRRECHYAELRRESRIILLLPDTVEFLIAF